MNVNKTALRVPIGMLLAGFFNSPLIFAPAIIPVKELNNTPKIYAKLVCLPFELSTE
jgi:hypothetical protein